MALISMCQALNLSAGPFLGDMIPEHTGYSWRVKRSVKKRAGREQARDKKDKKR